MVTTKSPLNRKDLKDLLIMAIIQLLIDEIAENVVYQKSNYDIPATEADKPDKKRGLLSKLFGKK